MSGAPLESEVCQKRPSLSHANFGFRTLGGHRMSDQGATPEGEIGTGWSLQHPSVPVPDHTQRAAILGQMSGGILHEFNNILTVISGTIDILAEAVIDRPELAAITRLIDEAAIRGERLTSHLIAFERGQPPQYHAVDVSALLSDAARLMRPVFGGRMDIAVSSSAGSMMAVADPSLLMAAILKLAIAAGNAMPDGGWISMAAAGSNAGDDAVDEAIEIKVDAIKIRPFLGLGCGRSGRGRGTGPTVRRRYRDRPPGRPRRIRNPAAQGRYRLLARATLPDFRRCCCPRKAEMRLRWTGDALTIVRSLRAAVTTSHESRGGARGSLGCEQDG